MSISTNHISLNSKRVNNRNNFSRGYPFKMCTGTTESNTQCITKSRVQEKHKTP